MTVRGTFGLRHVDKIDATMTVTMPIGEWKQIRESLKDKWPDWQFASLITDLISQAEKTFYANAEDGGSDT